MGLRRLRTGWACAVGLAVAVPFAGGQGVGAVSHPSQGARWMGHGEGTVMTAQQAKELFASVDEIMAFAANDTGLAPMVKVKRKLLTRDEVGAYLLKSFEEDESAKKLQRSEIVLKKFGLLNRDFNLRPFLLSLLTEQIAGFYDDKTKTVNLLNWVEPKEQKPVLAHELTHAIQDQKVGLEKWGSDGSHGVSKTASEDAARLLVDELETGRQAVTEGQAMVVFVDWGLPKGETLATSPDVGKAMKKSAADSSGSPVMSRAPLLLQRSLVFPYADGLSFEQALLIKGGKSLAFAGALANPPNSSFEIMHPDAYLKHAQVPSLRLPNVHAILDAEYEPYDVGVMGELDVEIMASLFGGDEIGAALAPAWDGGVYYAGQRRSASAAEKAATGSLGLMYFSRWKTEAAARAFAKMYAAEVGRKYDRVSERKGDEVDAGEQIFSTSEGDVLMTLSGKELFLAEGFSLAMARKLREEVNAVQGVGPMKLARAADQQELTLGAVGALARFGMVKPATIERYTSKDTFKR